MGREPIDASQKVLKEIFQERRYIFEIPSYQRPYSWGEKEAGELLDDLVEALEDDPERDYFLGSFVLIKSRASKRAEVVDGQQRLTTLTILFAAIRDLVTGSVREEAESFVLTGKDNLNPSKQGEPILLVRSRDNERHAFRRYVQDSSATAVERDPADYEGNVRRFVDNSSYLRKRLQKLDNVDLSELLRFMRDRCLVVVVEVPDPSAARRIFRVLNARGMDLDATDILKAQLLEKLPEDRRDAYAEQWENLESAVGRSEYGQLFAHIRMMHARRKPKKALEDGFAEDVPGFADQPKKFMDEVLHPVGEAYLLCADLQRVRDRFGDQVAKLIGSLHRVDNSDWWPPVLAFQAKFGSGSEVADSFEAFLDRFERLTYYLFVTRQRVNDRIARSAKVIDAINEANTVDDLVAHDALALSSDEQVEFAAALDGDLYLSSRVRTPVLLRLDSETADGAATYHRKATVEHVLPQTPDGEWVELFDETERRRWTHKAANLVLLTRNKNSQANRKPFADKKDGYFSETGGYTTFRLTQEVKEHDAWNPTILERRQAELRSRFSTIWDLAQP